MTEDAKLTNQGLLRGSMESLDNELQELAKLVDSLQIYLHPVIAPNEGQVTQILETPEAPKSEFRVWVGRMAEDVQRIKSQLAYISENLEV